MQHHGAPTRLLDFTYSLYVAAYFALETADSDCAVWALHGRWVLKQSVAALELAGNKEVTRLNSLLHEEDEQFCYDLIFNGLSANAAIPLNPFRLNERLRIQKGLFLIPGTISISFMENLTSLPGSDQPENVVKLILGKSIRAEALERLFYMNISRTSLFPGLDGYAQSLGVFHPCYKPMKWW